MTRTFRRSWMTAAVAVGLLAAVPVQAQTPAAAPDVSALRLVVGFPPGGALDTLARALSERLRLILNEPVLVENRPGASSRLSIEHVKRAAPDGRTILLASSAPFTIFPATYSKLGYGLQDFVPVAHLVNVPTVVSAGASQPYQTLGAYVAWVKAHPDKAGVGLTNLGGALHFAVLAMGKSIGVPLSPVPYKGGAPLATDIIGGHVPAGTDALASQLELHRAGKLRILGISGQERIASLPELPTLAEQGVDGFVHATASFNAFVPAGTRADQVQRLEAALLEALKDPQVVAQLGRAGLYPTGYPGAKLASMLRAEQAFWQPIVAGSGFKHAE